jgi:LysM repeat protein
MNSLLISELHHMSNRRTRPSRLAGLSVGWVAAVAFLVCPATAMATQAGVVPQAQRGAVVGDLSPAFLGVYRKVMEIEPEIIKYSKKYHVDLALARAVCMYESGGNANLTSGAGAHGYFQVMPSTFRSLGVRTNIEAGIKYLGQMVTKFGREDYALAAYNGGPTRVARGGPMPLESLQYVLGVGYYRSLLRVYEPSIRQQAERLRLTTTQKGDSWWRLSQRLEIPLIQLRLYNPFLDDRSLAAGGRLITYPRQAHDDLLDIAADGQLQYRTRVGDNYFNVAFAVGVDLDELRTANQLWRLQNLPPGMDLVIPLEDTDGFTEQRVRSGEDLADVASRLGVDPWQLVRYNNLWDGKVDETMVLRVPPAASARAAVSRVSARRVERPRFQIYRVRSGDNLTSIARRHGTTVAALQADNLLGRTTRIHPGQRLRIRAR